MFRRKFIKAASGTALAGLVAGCGGNGGGGNGGGNGGGDGTTTTTAEEPIGGETETPGETPAETPGETPAETPAETGTAGAETGTPVQDVETVVGNVPEGIEVSGTQLFVQENNARVTGTVENTSDQQFEELEVQATLIDDQNDILGRWFDDTEENEAGGLAAGATWNFAVEFESPDLDTVARVRVDVDGDIDQSVWDGTLTPA